MGTKGVTLPSGVQYTDIEIGKGLDARTGDMVTIHYIGKLENGTEFDNSYAEELPFTFEIGAAQVIPGLEEGIIGMNIGGKRELSIPADMAYGEMEIGTIPANANLLFEVELLAVK